MSNNVAEVLEGRATTLFEKLAQNNDLSNVIMAFLGRIVLMCNKMGKPIEGVITTEVNESNDEFRFGVTFNSLIMSPPGLWQAQGDILTYAKARSIHLAKALERNNKLMHTFTNLVEAVSRYCDRKGLSFKDFKIKKAFVHPKTNTCIVRAGVPDFKDKFR
jgi:hypothetical protein